MCTEKKKQTGFPGWQVYSLLQFSLCLSVFPSPHCPPPSPPPILEGRTQDRTQAPQVFYSKKLLAGCVIPAAQETNQAMLSISLSLAWV
jgi:hypothetical protein